MDLMKINPEDVDVVISVLRHDLSFLENWKPFLIPYHLIIVQDPHLEGNIQVPSGLNHNVYTKNDMESILGARTLSSLGFKGHSCRYFGYLISKKKFIISFDEDCLPAKDSAGKLVDAVEQHLTNLKTPSTPAFFNTLYDPYAPGADFVRGYPFSLREGVPCAISCGLWLNQPDYDFATLLKKSGERNNRYVDAVLTVPSGAMFPMSSINLAFNREIVGPAMFSGLAKISSSVSRYNSIEDIWCGLCCKLVCDHLGYGVKTGLPYVWRKDLSDPNLQDDSKIRKLLEDIFPFFQSIRLPRSALTVEDCFLEIGRQVKERLSSVDPLFADVGSAMESWIQAWKSVHA